MPTIKEILLISFTAFCLTGQKASEDISITVRSDEEAIINKTNLDRIKRFILNKKFTCTFSQMYNNNPFFQTDNYSFYLIPDPGGPHNHPQWNINCDPKKGDFNILTIRRKIDEDLSDDEVDDQYRRINFSNPLYIRIMSDISDPNMKIYLIRQFPEQAIKEILTIIQLDEMSKSKFKQ